MNDSNLPPIPRPGETGPQVCETIRLYLAVINDLTPQQKELLSGHVNSCPDCAGELQRLSRTTHLVASGLAHSTPSPRVSSLLADRLPGNSCRNCRSSTERANDERRIPGQYWTPWV